MTASLTARAGKAVVWKAMQLAGVKLVFLLRLTVLARILLPEDFGLVAVALVPLGVFLTATDLGTIPALVQHPGASRRHYDAAWTIGLGRAFLVAAAIFLLAPAIAGLAAEPRAVPFIRALALQPLFEAAASIRVAHLHRELDFRGLALVKLTEAVANTVLAVALAPFWGAWALVAGTLAGGLGGVAASYVVAPHRPRILFDGTASATLLRFGRWIFLAGLLGVLSSAALRLIVSHELGTAELGLYFLALRLALLPAEAATEVVGAVTFPLHARLRSDPVGTARAFRGALTGVAALLAPVTALLFVLAPALVENVLGARWQGTVPLIQLLAVAGLVGLLGEVTVPILKGVGQPHKVTLLEVAQAGLLVVLVWHFVGAFGLVGAPLAWLPAVTASQVLSVVFIRQILVRPFAGLWPPLFAVAAATAAGTALAWGIIHTFDGLAGLVLAGAAGGLLVLGLIWAADRRFGLALLDDLLRLFPKLRTPGKD